MIEYFLEGAGFILDVGQIQKLVVGIFRPLPPREVENR
jgi:hypothetical protein